MKCQKICQKRMSEDMSEEMPIEMSENMSEMSARTSLLKCLAVGAVARRLGASTGQGASRRLYQIGQIVYNGFGGPPTGRSDEEERIILMKSGDQTALDFIRVNTFFKKKPKLTSMQSLNLSRKNP